MAAENGGVPEAEVVQNRQFISTMVANCHLENIKHDISEIIWTYYSRILLCWCIIVLPSLSAIKCTVTDNKTANINDKNCSLSIALTAMDQKLQKS